MTSMEGRLVRSFTDKERSFFSHDDEDWYEAPLLSNPFRRDHFLEHRRCHVITYITLVTALVLVIGALVSFAGTKGVRARTKAPQFVTQSISMATVQVASSANAISAVVTGTVPIIVIVTITTVLSSARSTNFVLARSNTMPLSLSNTPRSAISSIPATISSKILPTTQTPAPSASTTRPAQEPSGNSVPSLPAMTTAAAQQSPWPSTSTVAIATTTIEVIYAVPSIPAEATSAGFASQPSNGPIQTMTSFPVKIPASAASAIDPAKFNTTLAARPRPSATPQDRKPVQPITKVLSPVQAFLKRVELRLTRGKQ